MWMILQWSFYGLASSSNQSHVYFDAGTEMGHKDDRYEVEKYE